MELTAPCNFGVEAILSREIKNLGYEITKTIDGRVSYLADELGICRSNLWLRTAERVYVKMGEFTATTFDELFTQTKELPWTEWLGVDAAFDIAKVRSIKSELFSLSDIQAIMKKAIVESLKKKYNQSWFAESGARYKIHVLLNKDVVSVYFDTTGPSLYKRGYRANTNIAPIKETLGAAMVDLMPWKSDRLLVDPLCGSGTIVIEAALKGLNIAPGSQRRFLAEAWPNIDINLWKEARAEARDVMKTSIEVPVYGYDIDPNAIKMARENAKNAGVDKFIRLQKQDIRDFQTSESYGFIVTNPPYGERMDDKRDVADLYRDMSKVFATLPTWSYSIITSYPGFESIWGKIADKRRKIYNGMLQTTIYQYFGPKPPKV